MQTGMNGFDSEALRRMLFAQFAPPREFAIAYSGGCDSHVLLHALMHARRRHDFGLRALHFDHGLLPESAGWAAHCEAVCREWGIPFAQARREVRRRPGQSLEAAARHARYRWFAQCVERGQVLLTAHHADDQAETLLLNALRGGGMHSLAGIRPQRALSAVKGTRVSRPLLAFSRAQLAEYARAHDLRWIDDPSNRAPQFDRNHLRHTIIPLLRQRWPGAPAALARAAAQCREAAQLLDAALLPLLENCADAGRRGVFCIASPLDARALQPHARARIIALLRLWLHRNGRRSPSDGQLHTFYAQVFEAGCARASLQCRQTELRYFDQHLYLTRLPARAHAEGGAPGGVDWDLRACDLGRGLRVEMRDYARGGLEQLQLRGRAVRLVWRKGGERMTLPGRRHSSALKKLFQQHGVPPWERRAVPLLAVDGEIAWAHGIGAAAACRARGAGVRPHFAAS